MDASQTVANRDIHPGSREERQGEYHHPDVSHPVVSLRLLPVAPDDGQTTAKSLANVFRLKEYDSGR